MSKKGIIDTSKLHTPPTDLEMETARYFADLGYDIVFLAPSNIPGVHIPDILMDGKEWEIKCPQGKGKRTIEHCFRYAISRSHFIIFDLRRIQLPEDRCLSELKRFTLSRKYVKCLLIIKKDGTLLSFPNELS